MASGHQKTEQPDELNQGIINRNAQTGGVLNHAHQSDAFHQQRKENSDEQAEENREFDVASPISPSP